MKFLRADYASEVTALREKISEFETQKNADKESLKTMQFLVDTLTQNKLDASNQIADLQRQTKEATSHLRIASQKCSQLEIECEAQQRQIKRLTDENAEQESDLMNLNERFSRVSELSQQQTQELLTLEKSVEQWKRIEQEFESLKTENRSLQLKLAENEAKAVETIEKSTIEVSTGREELQEELEKARQELKTATEEIASLKDSASKLSIQQLENIKRLKVEKDAIRKENEEQSQKLSKYKSKIIEFSTKLKQLKQCRDVLKETVTEYSAAIGQWQNQINEASKQLIEHIETLRGERDKLTTELTDRSSDSDKLSGLESALEEKCAAMGLLEKQNQDLLAEMRELNDAMKNRGNVISNQTSEIDELKQTHREQTERVSQLEELLNEKAKLLDQMRSMNDSQSDIMSTSTISRADEVARMHDIEDSFEEKYNKLRGLAVKLKKKVAEQQAIIVKLEVAGAGAGAQAPPSEPAGIKIQNLKSLQAENDRLMDQIDAMKAEQKAAAAAAKALNEKLQKCDEEIKSMQIVADQGKQTQRELEELNNAKEKEREELSKEVELLKNQMSKIEAELKKAKGKIE